MRLKLFKAETSTLFFFFVLCFVVLLLFGVSATRCTIAAQLHTRRWKLWNKSPF